MLRPKLRIRTFWCCFRLNLIVLVNCIDIGLCRIWLCMMCILMIKYTEVIRNIYSRITGGRVLDGELLCTKIISIYIIMVAITVNR